MTTGERPSSRLPSGLVQVVITGAVAVFATSSHRPGRRQRPWGALRSGRATGRQGRAWTARAMRLRARDSGFPGRHGDRPGGRHRDHSASLRFLVRILIDRSARRSRSFQHIEKPGQSGKWIGKRVGEVHKTTCGRLAGQGVSKVKTANPSTSRDAIMLHRHGSECTRESE